MKRDLYQIWRQEVGFINHTTEATRADGRKSNKGGHDPAMVIAPRFQIQRVSLVVCSIFNPTNQK